MKLSPQPWKEPTTVIKPKLNDYFHEKYEMWNSLAHSSPKIAQFYLEPNKFRPPVKPTPTQTSAPVSALRKTSSREQLKRRQLEREALQAKSSQCFTRTEKNDPPEFFHTFKDPAARPISNRIGKFDNITELPPERLKLIVNDKILKKDQEALNHMEKRIQQEVLAEEEIAEWHKKFRESTLSKMHRQQRLNAKREARAGLMKIKTEGKKQSHPASARIQSLSRAKRIKIGYPEDYMESYGLLNAGALQQGNSIHPRSARRPLSKRQETFPTLTDYRPDPLLTEPTKELEDPPIETLYTCEEIQESMQALNEFHMRFGELKGRVGFPHIYLQKYQSLS